MAIGIQIQSSQASSHLDYSYSINLFFLLKIHKGRARFFSDPPTGGRLNFLRWPNTISAPPGVNSVASFKDIISIHRTNLNVFLRDTGRFSVFLGHDM